MSAEWEAAARESYDRVAGPYAELTRSAPTTNAFMARDYAVLAELARQAAAPDQATVVDVGCGPGWWAGALARAGVRVVGIDVSPEMVRIAREHVRGTRFDVGSLLELPLESASATGVCCLYVLHHVPDADVERAVAELVRVLAPGGVLLIGGHIGDSRTVKRQGYGGRPMDVQVNKRPASWWADALERIGLVVEAHTRYDPGSDAASHALFARKPR